MSLKVIVTGASGMVGEGVLHECLNHPEVNEVLAISRQPLHQEGHPRLKVLLHKDFLNLDPVREQLKGYNACFFCLGVSSIGKKEEEFTKLTYDLTLHMGKILAGFDPDMTFCYVSGSGTDSSEKGRVMWARVKGKTENDLLKLFRNGYMFRPGYMQPTPGLKNTLTAYKYLTWLYPALKLFFPSFVCRLSEVGLAMINCALRGYGKKVLEVKDIKERAKA